MSAELATLARAALVGLGFSAAVSLAFGALWPLLRKRFSGAHPERRARVAWLAAVSPALLPAAGLALCFEPGLLAALGLHADHCVHHPDHAHLCLAHPSGGLTPLLATILAIGAGALGVALAREAISLRSAHRAMRRLVGRVAPSAPDVALVESEAVFSFAVGLFRPGVVVSTAVSRALPPLQLAAVIEHERAHARRREPLARLSARLLSWAHLPAVRRAILAEQVLASEQACDEAAVDRVGDRLVVAEAILGVERLLATGSTPEAVGLPAFGGSAVEARVRHLIGPAPVRSPARRGLAVVLLGGVAALALAEPFHHATEHLLGLLLRAF